MMDETRDLQQSGDLLDLYSQHYKLRYGVKPILSKNGSDQTLAKDLIRQHGYAKSAAFIEAFLKSEYWTFVNQRHPLRALLKDLNIVNIDVSKTQARNQAAKGPAVRIRSPRACDTPGCSTWIDWTGYPTDFVKPIFCDSHDGLPNRDYTTPHETKTNRLVIGQELLKDFEMSEPAL